MPWILFSAGLVRFLPRGHFFTHKRSSLLPQLGTIQSYWNDDVCIGNVQDVKEKALLSSLMQNLEESLLWVSTQPWGRIPAKPGNSSHSKTLTEVLYTKDGQSSKCTSKCINYSTNMLKYYIYLRNKYSSGPAKENSRASQIGRDGIDRESAKLNKV